MNPFINNKYKIKKEHLDKLQDALLLVRENKPLSDIQAASILKKLCPLKVFPYSQRKIQDEFMNSNYHKEAERLLQRAIKLHSLIMIRNTSMLKEKYYNCIAKSLSQIS